jgi:hypothetical protein
MVALRVKHGEPWQRPIVVSLVQLKVKLWAHKNPFAKNAIELKAKNFSILIT